MSVNIKDSTKPNKLNPIAGRISDDKYSYADALSLEEISASDPTLLGNKIPNAEAVGELNNNFGGLEFGLLNDKPAWRKAGADTFNPFSSTDIEKIAQYSSNFTYTFTEDINNMIMNFMSLDSGFTGATVSCSSGTVINLADINSAIYRNVCGKSQTYLISNVKKDSTLTVSASAFGGLYTTLVKIN